MDLVQCAGCRKRVKRSTRSKRTFCSRACYEGSKAGQGNPNWRARDLARVCPQCQQPFEDRGYAGKKFCSRDCKALAQRRDLTTDQAVEIIEAFLSSGLPFYAFAKREGQVEFKFRERLKAAAPVEFEAAIEKRRLGWDVVYRTGIGFERSIRARLIARGYVCMVAPRSMGPADLMAARAGRILLIQCKAGAGRIKRKEREALIACAMQAGGEAIVATPPDKFWVCRAAEKLERLEL